MASGTASDVSRTIPEVESCHDGGGEVCGARPPPPGRRPESHRDRRRRRRRRRRCTSSGNPSLVGSTAGLRLLVCHLGVQAVEEVTVGDAMVIS